MKIGFLRIVNAVMASEEGVKSSRAPCSPGSSTNATPSITTVGRDEAFDDDLGFRRHHHVVADALDEVDRLPDQSAGHVVFAHVVRDARHRCIADACGGAPMTSAAGKGCAAQIAPAGRYDSAGPQLSRPSKAPMRSSRLHHAAVIAEIVHSGFRIVVTNGRRTW